MQVKLMTSLKIALNDAVLFIILAALSVFTINIGQAWAADVFPSPLLEQAHPVDWWFVFKFNAKSFPGCGGGEGDQRQCLFGGNVQEYNYSQQFVYASSENQSLRKGSGCVGDNISDPLGATFDEVYNDQLFYVIWNDQFYDDPPISGGSTWGHSKGMLAWNAKGSGFVLQVTTPSWPAAGSKLFPRKSDGNTLGCVKDDNVKFSQHFFSLKLTKNDLIEVLKALKNASVVTDPENRQVVNNGGPAEVQSLVASLGIRSQSTVITKVKLSSGVELISKPSDLNVPPWQMVSAELGGTPLRTATWWSKPKINSTTEETIITCWDNSLNKPGAVSIATTGQWDGKIFGLKGGAGADFNHAKIGVSTAGNNYLSIFGDMNQQGTLTGPKCSSSQNGRGGLFYVMESKVLNEGIENLIEGDTAPTDTP